MDTPEQPRLWRANEYIKLNYGDECIWMPYSDQKALHFPGLKHSDFIPLKIGVLENGYGKFFCVFSSRRLNA